MTGMVLAVEEILLTLRTDFPPLVQWVVILAAGAVALRLSRWVHLHLVGALLGLRPRRKAGGEMRGLGSREETKLVTELQRVLDGDSHEVRQQMRQFLTKEPLFHVTEGELDTDMAEQRSLALLRAERFAKSGLMSVRNILSDPLRFLAAHEMLTLSDA